MSSFLYSLGHLAVRRRRGVIAAWLVVLALLGAGSALVAQGTQDTFDIPGTQSQDALDALEVRFPEVAGATAQIVVVSPQGTSVESRRAAVEELVAGLEAEPWVAGVLDPFSADVDGAISEDGRAVLIDVQLDVTRAEVTDEMREALHAVGAGLRDEGAVVEAGGPAFAITSPEMSPTELAGIVVAAVVLLVTFGSAVTAGIPILVAVVAAGVSMALIFGASAVTSISSTAPMLALMIGIAVGIDYALLILWRHREHLAQGLDVQESMARALATAGSAVVFAGAAVAIALLALSVAGIPFLTVIGVAAAGGVVIAVLGALTLLPAVAGAAGSRLAPRVSALGRKRSGEGAGLSGRVVQLVMRRPVAILVVLLVGLSLVAVPAKDLRLALPGPGTDAVDSTQRIAYDLIDEHFGPGRNGLLVVSADIITTTDPVAVVDDLATDLAAVDGVASVSLATPNPSGDTAVVVLVPTTAPTDERTAELVERIRDLAPTLEERYGITLAVTGHTALEIDVSERLAASLLPFALVVVGLSIILLTVVFRSLVVPLVGSLGYVLSVGASFGALAAVFEWGWAADLLGVQRTGPVISFLPIVVMGVLFGLAMDYQVFLVSRIREEYVRTGDAQAALRAGFVRSGPVITAAALIMAGVFAAFVPEGDAVLKPIAFALTVGVLVDAFLVRLVLMPAALSLFGRSVWWLPSWLDRILPHVDIEGDALARELEAEQRAVKAPRQVVQARGLTLAGPHGPVYTGVDLDVSDGDLCIVAGPPGSGKTALLLTLAGRMDPDSGHLLVAGHHVPDGSSRVRERVALAETPGVNDLDPALSVRQHLAERVATETSHVLLPAAQVDQVGGRYRQILEASGRPMSQPLPGDDVLVADLSPVDRALLGVFLATLGEPRLIVLDDADQLRVPGDRVALWRALESLVSTPRTDGHRLAVVVACQDPTQALAWRSARLVRLDQTDSYPAIEVH